MHAARFLSLVATLVISGAYLYVGTRPRNPELFRNVSDTVLHGAAYAALGLVAGDAAAAIKLAPAPLIGWGYAVGHGALLEAVQSLTPTRTAQVGDVLADAAGAALGAAVLVRRRLSR